MKEVCQICVWKGMSICSELLYVMMKDNFRKRIHDILIEYMNENDILYEIDEFESGKDFISLGINLASMILFSGCKYWMNWMEWKLRRKIRKVSNDVFIVFCYSIYYMCPSRIQRRSYKIYSEK